MQMSNATTEDAFQQVIDQCSDWLAGLGYITATLNIAQRHTLIQQLLKHELYSK